MSDADLLADSARTDVRASVGIASIVASISVRAAAAHNVGSNYNQARLRLSGGVGMGGEVGVTKFEPGDRVERSFDRRTGSVLEVEQRYVSQDSYLVRWDDGREDWENENDLRPA